MYACICARVLDRELRAVIRCGARTEDAVGEACGAGAGCGSCLDRIHKLIKEQAAADTLVSLPQ
jgi:bacterioferritin-associated ferredoxin